MNSHSSFQKAICVFLGLMLIAMGGCAGKARRGSAAYHSDAAKGRLGAADAGMPAQASGSSSGRGFQERDLMASPAAMQVGAQEFENGLTQDMLSDAQSGPGFPGTDIHSAGVSATAGNAFVDGAQQLLGHRAVNGLSDVYFDFDSWRLTEQAKETLESNSDWLLANPDEKVTIEGHCDRRGTHAYNFVLGERRATMTKNYLVSLGVPAPRLTVTSFGKERPQCLEETESCYRSNRRAHVVVGVDVADLRRPDSLRRP